jgi:integrase
MKLLLTDRLCQHAKSTEPQTDFFDETVRGLALRVTSNGTKAWTYHYGKPRRRVTLGRYPSISLATARSLALETASGRQSVMTVSALVDRYLDGMKAKRSVREVERRLRRDVLPIIGHVPLRDLHRRDVTRVIDGKITDAPILARRVFEDLRAMIRWAVGRGDLDNNPIDGMKGPAISKVRTRILTDDEIRTLWQALPKLGSAVIQRIIKLCLITGQRVGEVAGMQQSELDLRHRVWNIPGERTKNGHPHQVPLSKMALDLLDLSICGSTNHRSSQVTRAHVTDTIRDHLQLGFPRWTAHDLRRTALTGMAKLGVAPIVLGHVANHRTTTKTGITLGVYVQHQYEREKRAALELWADRLQGIVSGGAEVVAMRRSHRE